LISFRAKERLENISDIFHLLKEIYRKQKEISNERIFYKKVERALGGIVALFTKSFSLFSDQLRKKETNKKKREEEIIAATPREKREGFKHIQQLLLLFALILRERERERERETEESIDSRSKLR